VGKHRRITLVVTLAVTVAAALGCEDEKPPPQPYVRPPRERIEPRAADEARPGELAEGTEKAFGLPIPRRMALKARFPDAVYAEAAVSPERVANYVRERVEAAQVETGPGKTVWDKAVVKGGPTTPLRVEVTRVGSTTRLVVRDLTRPKDNENLSDDERWRRLGLTPQGKLADPNRME